MSEKFPNHLRYTKDHEWALVEGKIATIGVTHHAQEALGEIVYVEMPAVGKKLNKGDTFGVVESIKAVSDLYSPLSGTVTAVNTKLSDDPGKVNSEPYTGAWMVKLELSNSSETNELLDIASYKNLVESL